MPVIVGPGDPGTTVDLTSVWFNVADDLSDSQAFHRPVEGISANTTALVDVRQLIGRRRLVKTGSGDPVESWSVSLPRCTRAQVAWLTARVGVLMCVRDHVGTKFYGIYRDTPREVSSQYRDWISVKLTIDDVTHSEAV